MPRTARCNIGNARIMEPANGIAIKFGLINRLRSTHIFKFGWTIGRNDEHGDMRETGLDDGCVKMYSCGTRSAQQNGWLPSGEPDTESSKSGRTLVVKNFNMKFSSSNNGQGQRRRA